MSKVRIELNSAGVRALLRSEEIKAVCREVAEDAISRLGDGYSVNTFTGRNRVNAEILAESEDARRDNLENNSILKVLK